MARFARGRKKFHRRKFAKKRVAWINSAFQADSILLSSGGNRVAGSFNRALLLQPDDWVSNELLSETARVVRIVGSVDVDVWPASAPAASAGAISGTFWLQQAMYGALVLGDVDTGQIVPDANVDTMPGEPEYFLEHQVLKCMHGILQTSGSYSNDASGNSLALQDTSGAQKLRWSLNWKGSRRIGVDTTVFFDVCPAAWGSPFFRITDAGGGGPLGGTDQGDWRYALNGQVRTLVEFG